MRLKKLMRDIIIVLGLIKQYIDLKIYSAFTWGFFLLKRVRILYLFALYACKQQ